MAAFVGAAVIALGSLGGCTPVLKSPAGSDTGGACAPYVAPTNSWTQGSVPDGTCGEGWADGDVVDDAQFTDQNGAPVSIWQFYGDVVLLDLSTLWCSPCQDLAGGAQATADTYRDQGFVYLTVLVENLSGDPPTTDDLNSWGNAFGITEPIVSDDAHIEPILMPQNNYPGVFVIDRSMVIGPRLDNPTDDTIRAAIEAAL